LKIEPINNQGKVGRMSKYRKWRNASARARTTVLHHKENQVAIAVANRSGNKAQKTLADGGIFRLSFSSFAS
jgi:hypothetical protein